MFTIITAFMALFYILVVKVSSDRQVIPASLGRYEKKSSKCLIL